jgi:hypothetical protein
MVGVNLGKSLICLEPRFFPLPHPHPHPHPLQQIAIAFSFIYIREMINLELLNEFHKPATVGRLFYFS